MRGEAISKKNGEGHKPNSVYAAIYLGRMSPYGSLRPTRSLERAVLKRLLTWSCTGWGLPAARITAGAVSSYLTISPLPFAGRYLFCCTFHRLAAPGCYPAPCPAVFGLSSPPASRRASAAACPSPFLLIINRPSGGKYYSTSQVMQDPVFIGFVDIPQVRIQQINPSLITFSIK